MRSEAACRTCRSDSRCPARELSKFSMRPTSLSWDVRRVCIAASRLDLISLNCDPIRSEAASSRPERSRSSTARFVCIVLSIVFAFFSMSSRLVVDRCSWSTTCSDSCFSSVVATAAISVNSSFRILLQASSVCGARITLRLLPNPDVLVVVGEEDHAAPPSTPAPPPEITCSAKPEPPDTSSPDSPTNTQLSFSICSMTCRNWASCQRSKCTKAISNFPTASSDSGFIAWRGELVEG
mmetsp:Transcript_20398/g.51558  ORF Transcript_20398/g.51558 Transcript_20398/m.51558 type:complete len:238 (-) Transcript_20398:408-1121(-)